jgi:hypothetical protein
MKLFRCALALAIILPCAAFAQGSGGGGSGGSGGGSAGGGVGGAASSGAGGAGTSSPSPTNAASTAGAGPANPAGTATAPTAPPSAMLPERRSPASITNRHPAPMRPAPLLLQALPQLPRRQRLPAGLEGQRPRTSRIATLRSTKRTPTPTGWWEKSAKTANEHRVTSHDETFVVAANLRDGQARWLTQAKPIRSVAN